MSTKLELEFKPIEEVTAEGGACWTHDEPGATPIVICECKKPVNLVSASISVDGEVKPDLDHGCEGGPFTVTLLGYKERNG